MQTNLPTVRSVSSFLICAVRCCAVWRTWSVHVRPQARRPCHGIPASRQSQHDWQHRSPFQIKAWADSGQPPRDLAKHTCMSLVVLLDERSCGLCAPCRRLYILYIYGYGSEVRKHRHSTCGNEGLEDYAKPVSCEMPALYLRTAEA